MPNKLGKMIDYFRKRDNLTLDELGKRLNKSPSAVSRWISGDRSPMVDDLIKLTQLFDTDVDTLMYGRQVKDHLSTYPLYEGTQNLTHELTDDDYHQITVSDSVMGNYAGRKDIKVFSVRCESMNEMIPYRSLVAAQQIQFDQLKDDDIVVFTAPGQLSIKQYFKDKQHQRHIVRPRSTDDTYIDQIIPFGDENTVEIIGKVVVSVVYFQ
ncbi:XRE family transcriptional regulator [Streptococcus mutans]|nr:XRE family transcriptional regulator [Streptococcus mutans]